MYFEKGAPREGNLFRKGKYGGRYKVVWYNPRSGEWLDRAEVIELDSRGVARIPSLPNEHDWAMKLVLD